MHNCVIEKFYTEKPKAKEDELLPSRNYYHEWDPKIEYDWNIRNRDII